MNGIKDEWTTDDGSIRLLIGDCLESLRTLPDECVNCCVTSPPYWGLRDYGHDGQIGLESTPEAYVAKMMEVFREVRRVLRKDGTCWVNLGDSYCNTDKWGGGGANTGKQTIGWEGGKADCEHDLKVNKNGDFDFAYCTKCGSRASCPSWNIRRRRDPFGLKPKDLVGIPWRVAFALQADGWWLRGDNVWGKPNGMPESVTDRPTRSHEYVFLLTKSERYFYDSAAVRTAPKASTITRLAQDIENQKGSTRANGGGKTNGTMKAVRKTDKQRGHTRRHAGFNDRWDAMKRDEQMSEGANLRSVWWIPPAQCKDSHFAVMPENVARICILAGCPDGGVVLDPFAGSGTVAQVAIAHGRQTIACELNPDYGEMVQKRIRDELDKTRLIEKPKRLVQKSFVD